MAKKAGKKAAGRKTNIRKTFAAKIKSFRKSSWRTRVAVVVVIAVFAMGGQWVYGQYRASVHASIAAKCQGSELFIGVRGSGEKEWDNWGHGRIAGAVLSDFKKDMKPYDVADSSVDYMAIAVDDFRVVGMYDKSYAHGVQQLQNALYYWNSKCKDYHFVIAGYSQGADAVAQVMSTLNAGSKEEATILGKIDGVVLFGDPRYNPDDKAVDAISNSTRSGILSGLPSNHGGKRPKFDAYLSQKIRSYCRPGDPICQITNYCYILKFDLNAAACVHSINSNVHNHIEYKEGGQTEAAALWLANRVKAVKLRTNLATQSTLNKVPVTTAAPSTPAPTPAPAKTNTQKSTTSTKSPTPTATTPTTTSPTPAPTPTPTPTPTVNRQGITSYDRMQSGAPYHGYFNQAWQNFTAQSNTITYLAATVGSPGASAGITVSTTLRIRLCTTASCTTVLAEAHPNIVNYGATTVDIGDVAVTPGATYYIEWDQPAALNGKTWVTYWWSGGSTISTSDQLQATVRGYNR